MPSSPTDDGRMGRSPTHLSADSALTGRLRSRSSSAVGSFRIGLKRSTSKLRQVAGSAANNGSLRSGWRELVSSNADDLDKTSAGSIPWADVLVLSSNQGDQPSVSMGICPIAPDSNHPGPRNLVLIKHNIVKRGARDEPVYGNALRELKSLVTSLSQSPWDAMSETERERHRGILDLSDDKSWAQRQSELTMYDSKLQKERQEKLNKDHSLDSVLTLNTISPTEVAQFEGDYKAMKPFGKCRLQPDLVSDLWDVGQASGSYNTGTGVLTGPSEQDDSLGGPVTNDKCGSRLTLELGPPIRNEQDNGPWMKGLSNFGYQSSATDAEERWRRSEICSDK